MLVIVMLLRIGRRVIDCTLLDPCLNQGHVALLQRRFSFWHPHLPILGRDHFEDRALTRLARNNCRAFAVTTSEELVEIGHYIAALGFCGLMTSLAVGLENWADVAVITDRMRLSCLCRHEDPRHGENQRRAEYIP